MVAGRSGTGPTLAISGLAAEVVQKVLFGALASLFRGPARVVARVPADPASDPGFLSPAVTVCVLSCRQSLVNGVIEQKRGEGLAWWTGARWKTGRSWPTDWRAALLRSSTGPGGCASSPRCSVRLSRYNSTEWCALHESPASTQRPYDTSTRQPKGRRRNARNGRRRNPSQAADGKAATARRHRRNRRVKRTRPSPGQGHRVLVEVDGRQVPAVCRLSHRPRRL